MANHRKFIEFSIAGGCR